MTSGRRAATLASAAVGQFVLIVVGVYLGLQADQWRENRSHADAARATLANLRRELVQNRAEIVRRVGYHDSVATRVRPLMMRTVYGDGGAVSIQQLSRETGFDGTKDPDFATTAWDLALTTQSLAYLDPALAFDLSAVYTRQQAVAKFADQVLTAMLVRNDLASRDVSPSLLMLENYFRQTARDEHTLLSQYDALLPRIERELRR